MMGGATRVSIPATTRKMVQSIKEVTWKHSDEEILAMLEECGMNPDETTQKLLLQDTFHEVKRKRDKKKENLSSKDSAASRWRSDTQKQGNRGGQMNFYTRNATREAGDAMNSSKRESGTKQVSGRAADPSVSTINEKRSKEAAPVSSFPVPSAKKLDTAPPYIGHDDMRTQAPREQHATKNNYQSKSRGAGKTHLVDSSQLSRPASGNSNNSGSRPSSNNSSRSQRTIGSQKAGSNKEWRLKPANLTSNHVSGASSAPEMRASNVVACEEEMSRLQKVEDLHLFHCQHVIIPNHIHVPDSERTKLNFGSFDAGVDLTSNCVPGPEDEKNSPPLSPNAVDVGESQQEASSKEIAPVTEEEGNNPNKSELPLQVPEELSSHGAVSTNTVQEYRETEQESGLTSENIQSSSIHSSTSYNIGSVPPVQGSQVQQPFHPASYYAQFYGSSPDADGQVSPFLPPGMATKYNRSVTVLPQYTLQSPQENGSSVLATAIPSTPLVTQAAGFMQNSMGVCQQPFPVFRPPVGTHISHYPSNYPPYGYLAPIYGPPPTIHQFLGNRAFPQQLQAGIVYPPPPPHAATDFKYSVPQFKTGINTGYVTHIGMPGSSGPYGPFAAGHNHGSAATAGNSTAKEDVNASQEVNVYSAGHQSKASPLWIAGPRRDMPLNAFYNVPPPGHHVAFAPTQAARVFYHPAQTAAAAAAGNIHQLMQQSQPMAGAVDMGRPPMNVFQQPPQSQINWPSSY